LPALVTWIKQGKVKANSWVFKEQDSTWSRASDLTELKILFKSKLPPTAAASADALGIQPGSLRRIKMLADVDERLLAFQERKLAIQERQLALQEQSIGVQKEQSRQTRRRSNQAGALRSPFNPRGDKDFPMPQLKCEMWIPYKITDPHQGGLTREEVELLNLWCAEGMRSVKLAGTVRIVAPASASAR
jgi:hypothetical protein